MSRSSYIIYIIPTHFLMKSYLTRYVFLIHESRHMLYCIAYTCTCIQYTCTISGIAVHIHSLTTNIFTLQDPQAGMNLTEIIRQLNKHHHSNISPSSSHSSLSMDSAKSNPQQGEGGERGGKRGERDRERERGEKERETE